jgi:cell division protein FtsX
MLAPKIFVGFFSYLLIFQILMVSGLMLALLRIMYMRMKKVSETESDIVSAVSSAAPIVEGLSPAAEKELRDKITKLEADNSTLANSNKDNSSLVDKIKYLESKLLEYEILQEEITTLTNLKNENETLKAQLLELQKPQQAKAA